MDVSFGGLVQLVLSDGNWNKLFGKRHCGNLKEHTKSYLFIIIEF